MAEGPGGDAREPAREYDDGELVRRIAEGGSAGHAAEGLLCQRYALRVRLYGLRHLGDAQRAEDLVQSVLLVVLMAARAGSIDEPDKLDRFVLGVSRNTALRVRAQARRADPVSDEQLAAIPSAPFELADSRALMRCLDRLETRAKQVVMLSFHEERSAEEIAEALALSAGNVRVVRHRALSALRACLDEPGRATR